MDKQYIGQVVRAKTLDQVEDPHYKLRALIETGDLKGRECLVCHRGSPDTLMKDLVIRLDQLPNQEPANLDGMVTGFFVTSHVPQGFEYSAPRDVLLYGVWQNRMADADFDVPRQRIVLQHYWVGHTPFVLYYQDRQGAIVPYRLANGRLQPLRKGGSPRQKGNRVRTVGNALRRYLKRFETQSEGIFSAAPRLVVIDENIQKPGQIFEEMRATGLKSIMLEPQQ